MFDTNCTLPLTSDLFALAIHPEQPLISVGLSSGHVSTLQLPAVDDEPVAKKRRGSNGTDIIDTIWRTRRHKGSCRCLTYSLDGAALFSAGTEGIIKAASSETGKVNGKLAIPTANTRDEDVDEPSVLHALSPQTVLLATDSGALHLYDLRTDTSTFTGQKPAQTHHPHADFISSLTPLPPSSASTSGYSKQWLSTGGTTLALTDLRRGVLVRSEDQEELLLSSLYVNNFPGKKTGNEKALVGCGDGVITLWEKGAWDDQDERIIVSPEKETLDAMAMVPEGLGYEGRNIAVGVGDGKIKLVKLGPNKIVDEVIHDEFEGVVALGFDVAGRMVSGGGAVVKVWGERVEDEGEGVEEEEFVNGDGKRNADSSEGGEDDSSEEELPKEKKRKKKKRRKGKKDGNGGGSFNFAGLD